MMELGLIDGGEGIIKPMAHNDSAKFESCFVNVEVSDSTNAVMLKGLGGSKLGIWVAHGEGKFGFEGEGAEDFVSMRYVDSAYPANPNGSAFNAAAVSSKDGRHLAMMPHLERAIFPWQWGYYTREGDQMTPWLSAFVNAREWLKNL